MVCSGMAYGLLVIERLKLYTMSERLTLTIIHYELIFFSPCISVPFGFCRTKQGYLQGFQVLKIWPAYWQVLSDPI